MPRTRVQSASLRELLQGHVSEVLLPRVYAAGDRGPRSLLLGDRNEDRNPRHPLSGGHGRRHPLQEAPSWRSQAVEELWGSEQRTRHLLTQERGAHAVWWPHLVAAPGSAV